jgi:hypothetical protein
MNQWSHFLAALALAIMTFTIHIFFRNDSNVKQLDKVRLFSLVRQKGDVGLALTYLNPQNPGMSDACATRTNLSSADASCRTFRENARTNILKALQCDKFHSQVCSFTQTMVNAIVAGNRTASNFWFQSKDLTARLPNSDVTFRQAIYNGIEQATFLLHNAFVAKQDKAYVVLRTTLYDLITITTLANIVVHISDAMPGWSWKWRLVMRVGWFIISYILSIIGIFSESGAVIIVVVFIFIPALIALIYFELFLDDPDVRPWVHPYAFSIIMACTSLLALTENNILNTSIVVVELLKAQAASQLYMEVVWYWTGYMEKKRLKSNLTEVYKTQQVQYALFMGIVVVSLLPLLQFMGPYDYNYDDRFLMVAPLLFTAIAVIGTIFLQGLILDDEYGIDVDQKTDRYVMPMKSEDHHSHQIYLATRITGGKLGVSMLVIIFVVLLNSRLLSEYFSTLRAYTDIMPVNAIQYDLSKNFLWGAGLTSANVLAL